MALTFQAEPSRGTKGSWKPGQSGNPKGRPANVTAQEFARAYTVDAIKALVVALRYPKERVPAAIALLDRGWGKPQLNVRAEHDVNVLHLIAAQALGIELQASVQTDVSTPAIEATTVEELPKE